MKNDTIAENRGSPRKSNDLYDSLLYEKSAGVAMITLHRPNVLNAINFQMVEELSDALKNAAADHEIRVILITGTGKYFTSGADLSILSSLEIKSFRRNHRKYWLRLFEELESMVKPTIAGINGPAIGGGVELALCCDLRYCSDTAIFRMPQIDFGLIPDVGATFRLPRMVGFARAAEMILGGHSLNAGTAERIGLVNEVYASDHFAEEVRGRAEKMAEKPSLALEMGKQLLKKSLKKEALSSHLDEVMEAQMALISTDDYQEAVLAFREQRAPRFRGKKVTPRGIP